MLSSRPNNMYHILIPGTSFGPYPLEYEPASGYRLCGGGLVTGDHHHGRFLAAPAPFISLQASACFFLISSAKKSAEHRLA